MIQKYGFRVQREQSRVYSRLMDHWLMSKIEFAGNASHLPTDCEVSPDNGVIQQAFKPIVRVVARTRIATAGKTSEAWLLIDLSNGPWPCVVAMLS